MGGAGGPNFGEDDDGAPDSIDDADFSDDMPELESAPSKGAADDDDEEMPPLTFVALGAVGIADSPVPSRRPTWTGRLRRASRAMAVSSPSCRAIESATRAVSVAIDDARSAKQLTSDAPRSYTSRISPTPSLLTHATQVRRARISDHPRRSARMRLAQRPDKSAVWPSSSRLIGHAVLLPRTASDGSPGWSSCLTAQLSAPA